MAAITPEIEGKIGDIALHLQKESTLKDLHVQYRNLFGVATRSKDKQKISQKIARELMVKELDKVEKEEQEEEIEVEGSDLETEEVTEQDPQPSQQSTPAPSSPASDTQAQAALIRVKSCWDEVKKLKEERKEKKAEQTKVISDHTDAIDEVLTSKEDANSRVDQLENHWMVIKRAKDKRTSISEEFNDKIKTASQLMEKELSNVKQGVLPFMNEGMDDEDDDDE